MDVRRKAEGAVRERTKEEEKSGRMREGAKSKLTITF